MSQEHIQRNEIETDCKALMFNIRRSVRYHTKRKCFFEGCYRLVLFAGLLAGPATVAIHEMAPWEMAGLIPSLTVSFLFAICLVGGLLDKAVLHNNLIRELTSLEKELDGARNNLTPELIARFRDDVLHTEAREPPVLQVLNFICHNELSLAIGYKQNELYQVRFHQRLLRHFIDWRPDNIQQVR